MTEHIGLPVEDIKILIKARDVLTKYTSSPFVQQAHEGLLVVLANTYLEMPNE